MSDWPRYTLSSVLICLILGNWARAHIMSATFLSLIFVHSESEQKCQLRALLDVHMWLCHVFSAASRLPR